MNKQRRMNGSSTMGGKKAARSPHSSSEHPIEELRMGTGGECVRQDNAKERHGVIEISIKEVISGVIAEVL